MVDDSFKIQNKNSKEILKKLRTKIPNFKKLEINNNLGIDFQLMIVFYSKIRHLSVHEGGIVPNKELFIKKVLDEANISSKKEYSQYIAQKVDDFFEKDMLILKTIHFKEKNELGVNIEMNTDRFNDLLGKLGSYIYMIQIEVLKYTLE